MTDNSAIVGWGETLEISIGDFELNSRLQLKMLRFFFSITLLFTFLVAVAHQQKLKSSHRSSQFTQLYFMVVIWD